MNVFLNSKSEDWSLECILKRSGRTHDSLEKVDTYSILAEEFHIHLRRSHWNKTKNGQGPIHRDVRILEGG